MITDLPETASPSIPDDLYRRASVQEFLWAIETYAPGWDISADRAISLGLVIAQRAREGHLEAVRTLGVELGFDLDELDVLISATFTWLTPGDLPPGLRDVDPENTFGRSPFDQANADEPHARVI